MGLRLNPEALGAANLLATGREQALARRRLPGGFCVLCASAPTMAVGTWWRATSSSTAAGGRRGVGVVDVDHRQGAMRKLAASSAVDSAVSRLAGLLTVPAQRPCAGRLGGTSAAGCQPVRGGQRIARAAYGAGILQL